MLHSSMVAATILAAGAVPACEAYEANELVMDTQVLRHERRMRKTQRAEPGDDVRAQSQQRRKRVKVRESGFGELLL